MLELNAAACVVYLVGIEPTTVACTVIVLVSLSVIKIKEVIVDIKISTPT